jgi:hypothetical protein
MNNKQTGKRLQQKADAAKDEKIKAALIKADICGLSSEEAKAKLNNIIKQIIEE